MILVDTTVWVNFFRGEETVEARCLKRALEERRSVAITDIILTEILRGISSDKEYRVVQKRLGSFPSLAAEPPRTFLHAAELYRRCRKKGVTVRSTVDCLIAAVCIESGATLLHRDLDFKLLAKHTRLKTLRPPEA